MFHIVGILFFVIIFIVLLGVSILWGVIMKLTNLFRKPQGRKSYSSSQSYSSTSQRSESRRSDDNAGERKKLFDDDEGEYVDFEEVED